MGKWNVGWEVGVRWEVGWDMRRDGRYVIIGWMWLGGGDGVDIGYGGSERWCEICGMGCGAVEGWVGSGYGGMWVGGVVGM